MIKCKKYTKVTNMTNNQTTKTHTIKLNRSFVQKELLFDQQTRQFDKTNNQKNGFIEIKHMFSIDEKDTVIYQQDRIVVKSDCPTKTL